MNATATLSPDDAPTDKPASGAPPVDPPVTPLPTDNDPSDDGDKPPTRPPQDAPLTLQEIVGELLGPVPEGTTTPAMLIEMWICRNRRAIALVLLHLDGNPDGPIDVRAILDSL